MMHMDGIESWPVYESGIPTFDYLRINVHGQSGPGEVHEAAGAGRRTIARSG
jgi:hypothetical protein